MSTLFKPPARFFRMNPLWHVDSGAHTWPVWKNDLYLLAQRLFRDDKSGSQ